MHEKKEKLLIKIKKKKNIQSFPNSEECRLFFVGGHTLRMTCQSGFDHQILENWLAELRVNFSSGGSNFTKKCAENANVVWFFRRSLPSLASDDREYKGHGQSCHNRHTNANKHTNATTALCRSCSTQTKKTNKKQGFSKNS